MTTSGETPRLAALRGPELGRRPRRRHGLVLLLYAAAAFGVLGLCLAALGPANELPEGMLSMSLVLTGAMALALGCALLLVGLLLLARAPSAQAGWYVDPVDRDIARWWDGQRWTEHTDRRSSEVVRLEPLGTSSRRRRVVGSWLLLGGIVVTTGCVLLLSAAPSPTTDVGDAAT
ncbi:MAG TPA: DUF2510 domain-containing protein, partial [Candidatus Nanopelagicales bacterium]|nr:DUF2510 domain-containing protein [Candidatus Nanopelagicales bacterium]